LGESLIRFSVDVKDAVGITRRGIAVILHKCSAAKNQREEQNRDCVSHEAIPLVRFWREIVERETEKPGTRLVAGGLRVGNLLLDARGS
jgi:hypothetical protein